MLIDRYGWRLHDLYTLTPREYKGMSDAALKSRQQASKDNLIAQAFGQWLAGNGGNKNFEDYLRYLGLSEKKKKPKVSNQIQANIARAKSIVERDRARTIQNRR